MPVHYRTFYVKKLMNIKEKERHQADAAAGKNESNPQKFARGPAVNKS